MRIDLIKLGLEKAMADYLKEDFTEETKEYLRQNPTITGNSFLVIKRSTQPAKMAYPIEQQKAIDEFIKQNGFTKVEIEPAKPDYKIELIATEKARRFIDKIFKLALKLTIQNNKTTTKLIQKVSASKTSNKIKKQ